MIEVLLEKRTALITHAVTKGLNPDIPLKDSGVEWLGKIPAHWEVMMLKRIAEISYGIVLELDRTLTDGTPILISLPNVSIDGELNLRDIPFTQYERMRPFTNRCCEWEIWTFALVATGETVVFDSFGIRRSIALYGSF